MDVFKEKMVRKMLSRNDKICRFLIIVSAVALAFMCFFITIGTPYILFGMFFAALALYGGYYLVTNFDVEYEYIITNGEIDFDKITAQRSRKRLCTIAFNTATAFGVADDSADTANADTYVKASADDPELTNYFIRVRHKSLGDTVVYFTPDDELLGLIKPFLPRNLRENHR